MEIEVLASDRVDPATRVALRGLWDGAFGDRFSDHDADSAYGGLHVLAREGGEVVGHAGVVPRRIRFGEEEWRTIGYVEAALRWPVAMLSTGRAKGFYESLGWERWHGASYTMTAIGTVLDAEHGGLMILRLEPTVVPDLDTAVTCEDRPGDAW